MQEAAETPVAAATPSAAPEAALSARSVQPFRDHCCQIGAPMLPPAGSQPSTTRFRTAANFVAAEAFDTTPRPRSSGGAAAPSPRVLSSVRRRPQRTQPLDALTLPVRVVNGAIAAPSSPRSPREHRPSTAAVMQSAATARARPLWHQQAWGVGPGYRQNDSVLAAARAAERKPARSVASTYTPTGICLSPDGSRFVVRPADAALALFRERCRATTNAPETSERNQGAKGRIQVKYGGPTATRDQQSAARAAANPATPRTFVPRNTVW